MIGLFLTNNWDVKNTHAFIVTNCIFIKYITKYLRWLAMLHVNKKNLSIHYIFSLKLLRLKSVLMEILTDKCLSKLMKLALRRINLQDCDGLFWRTPSKYWRNFIKNFRDNTILTNFLIDNCPSKLNWLAMSWGLWRIITILIRLCHNITITL